MHTPQTPVTPVELMAARPRADESAFGDASLTAADGRSSPSRIERFLQSPLQFWLAESVLLIPVALFLLQGLLESLGQAGPARIINDFLFSRQHTMVRDIFGPLVLPAVGVILALARIREAKPGRDRRATIAVALAGIVAMGIVLGYALLEQVGSFLR